ncbi:MAG TPA: dihydroorotate dehydrogenase-like protein [Pyrinomonadaceae bacterium]|nr:dihydroorotate dehydrogenase-like protein [Pyrinomonadaceae bacterium]
MNLSTKYMGLNLKNPLVASSSPLSHTVEGIRRLEDAGAGAVVMYSLFEEQISLESYYIDYYLSHGTNSFSEAQSYFPELHHYNVGPDEYLNLIRQAKEAVDVPIIGSLNGVSNSGWIDYARLIEQAGADAIELNVYFIPTRLEMTGLEVEGLYTDILCEVRNATTLPVAVKLSPYFSSTPNMAQRLADWGANALVLFNRFYQPDFDIEKLEVVPRLVLSDSHDLRLPLTWVAILYGKVPVDFAITSGIHTYADVLKALMAGANVAMMASELLQNGVGRIHQILREVQAWTEDHEYESLSQMIGSMSQRNVAEPAAFERANYMKMLDAYRPIN